MKININSPNGVTLTDLVIQNSRFSVPCVTKMQSAKCRFVGNTPTRLGQLHAYSDGIERNKRHNIPRRSMNDLIINIDDTRMIQTQSISVKYFLCPLVDRFPGFGPPPFVRHVDYT
jgi:hypothetical protein